MAEALHLHRRLARRYQVQRWLQGVCWGLGLVALLRWWLRWGWLESMLAALLLMVITTVVVRYTRQRSSARALHWIDAHGGLSYRSALESCSALAANPATTALAIPLQRRALAVQQQLRLPRLQPWWLVGLLCSGLLLGLPRTPLLAPAQQVATLQDDAAASPPDTATSAVDEQNLDPASAEQRIIDAFLQEGLEPSEQPASNPTNREEAHHEVDATPGDSSPPPANPFAPLTPDTAQGADAGAQDTDAGAQDTDAGAQGADAGAQGTDARAQGADAGAQGTDARAQGTDAEAQGTDARAQGTDAEAQGTDARAQGTDARAQGTDARAQGTDAEAQGTDAEAQGTDAGAQGTDAETQAGAASAQEDANAAARQEGGASAASQPAAQEGQQSSSGADAQPSSRNAAGGEGSGSSDTAPSARSARRLETSPGQAELLGSSRDSGERISIGEQRGGELGAAPSWLSGGGSSIADAAELEQVIDEWAIPRQYHESLRNYFR